MTRLFISGLTCMVFSVACRQNKTVKLDINYQKSTSKKTLFNLDTGRIAILNLTSNPWLSKRFTGAKDCSLTNDDIKAVDEIFNKGASANNIDTVYFHYKRQYVPFTDKDGQKKVWVNCFCSEQNDNEFPYWKQFVVMVDDGGSCFFNLLINLTDHSFSNFEVNGVG